MQILRNMSELERFSTVLYGFVYGFFIRADRQDRRLLFIKSQPRRQCNRGLTRPSVQQSPIATNIQ